VGLRQLLGVVKSFPNNTNLFGKKSRLHLLWDGGSRREMSTRCNGWSNIALPSKFC
jgi:hypothetical protein